MRKQVSLLLANGHPLSPHYPVHRVWEEAFIVAERTNLTIVTEAVMTQLAVASLLSKDAGTEFKKVIRSMTNEQA